MPSDHVTSSDTSVGWIETMVDTAPQGSSVQATEAEAHQ